MKTEQNLTIEALVLPPDAFIIGNVFNKHLYCQVYLDLNQTKPNVQFGSSFTDRKSNWKLGSIYAYQIALIYEVTIHHFNEALIMLLFHIILSQTSSIFSILNS